MTEKQWQKEYFEILKEQADMARAVYWNSLEQQDCNMLAFLCVQCIYTYAVCIATCTTFLTSTQCMLTFY